MTHNESTNTKYRIHAQGRFIRGLGFFVLLGITPLHGSAQGNILDKEITTYRTFGGMRFEMDTLTLTHRQVGQLLSINSAARMEFAKARRANTFSGLLGFTGAVLLAIPVFTSVLGGEPEWVMAAAGAGLIVASIPLSLSYKRKSEKAIDTYNAGLKRARVYLAPTGVAIRF